MNITKQKTEAMVFMGGSGSISVSVTGRTMPVRQNLKYLGIVFDSRWCFREHFRLLHLRAKKMAVALSRLMLNLGGPSEQRRLYASIVHSVLMYRTLIWACLVIADRGLCERVGKLQRRIALRVIADYRTISHNATVILSGIVAFREVALQCRRMYISVRVLKEQAESRGFTARARHALRTRERAFSVVGW